MAKPTQKLRVTIRHSAKTGVSGSRRTKTLSKPTKQVAFAATDPSSTVPSSSSDAAQTVASTSSVNTKMFDVFRFNILRSAQQTDPSQAILIQPMPEFYPQGGAAMALKALITTTNQTNPPASSVPPLNFAQGFQSFAEYAEAYGPGGATTLSDLGNAISSDFGEAATTLVNDAQFQSDALEIGNALEAVWKSAKGLSSQGISLFASMLGLSGSTASALTTAKIASTLTLYLQLIDIINRIGGTTPDQTLNSPSAVTEALQKIIILNQSPCSKIQPIGVMDLQVVKDIVIGYEPDQLSYVYNVLKSEKEDRTTIYTQSSSLTTAATTTTSQTTSKDLETDQRFNLQNQVSQVVQNQSNLSGSLSVSASYGTTVNVKANASASTSNSTTNSSQQSQDFSKDIINKASSQITRTVTQAQTQVAATSFQETNDHAYDNTQGSSNIAGIYQFIDEIHQAQVFNYGSRLTFDVTIPEPAAFVIDAIRAANTVASSVGKPPPIDFATYQLTDGSPDMNNYVQNSPAFALLLSATPNATAASLLKNFLDAASPYNITTILNPPPEEWVEMEYSVTEAAQTIDGQTGWQRDFPPNKVDSVQIPAGYEAVSATLTVNANPSADGVASGNSWVLSVAIGDSPPIVFGNAPNWPGQNANNTTVPVPLSYSDPSSNSRYPIAVPGANVATIPLGFSAANVSAYNAMITFHCQRTTTAIINWQNTIYSQIVTQYSNLLSNYQNAQAAAQAASAGTSFQGSNPSENTKIIQTELKKLFLGMLTDQNAIIGKYGAIMSDVPSPSDPSKLSGPATPQYPYPAGSSDPYPAPNETGYFPEVNTQLALQQGPTVRFFEEAFEWENIQYVFYPYYWGRQPYWYDRVLLEDPDPDFAEFLRAGAARVVVPVRPGWEGVVAYYLNTCIVWDGGDLPGVVTPAYMDIASEIMAMENGPSIDNPSPVGPPWQYKLPTTQVYLRGDRNLPYWFQDPTTNSWLPGTWVTDQNGNTVQQWIENRDGTWIQNPTVVGGSATQSSGG